MELAFAFIAGIIIGMLVAAFATIRMQAGTLKIDKSNPEKDVYLLEIDDLDNIDKKDFIILRVNDHASISQK